MICGGFMTDETQAQFRQKILKIKSLPTLPAVAQEVTQMIEDTNVSAQQLAYTIARDQALAGKLLRLVNSSFYGFPRRISSISNAIVLLGFNVVKSLLISVSVFEMMRTAMAGLWEHSLGCALATRIICRHLPQCNAEELAVAGLLHDIGKVVIATEASEAYESVQILIRQDRQPDHVAEKQILGIDHAEIGGALLDAWNLPLVLQHPVRYHHHPFKTEEHCLAAVIVHLADLLIRGFGYGTGQDLPVTFFDPQAWKLLGLNDEQLEAIIGELGEELEVLEANTAMLEDEPNAE